MTRQARREWSVGARRLWDDICADYDLTSADYALLEQACHCYSEADKLQAFVDKQGRMLVSREKRYVHPAVGEVRRFRSVFTQIMSRLLHDDQRETTSTRNRKYGIRGVV